MAVMSQSNLEGERALVTPMHRASQPEEIAEVVAFLASPRASGLDRNQ